MAEKNRKIKGISVCNPVDPQRDYLMYTVDYAIEHELNHMQVIGPIHHGVKGNIDGMTLYRKYEQFNHLKDLDYMEKTLDIVNEACEKASKHGLKMYQWHHELELPVGFENVFPDVTNSFGDVEVTHPIVKDFLENKILDFFHAYPLMDGIILTLHETRIPLLKLKDQKLGKVERVLYVTKILYDTCKSLGKELIVRPFASTEEDYVMMAEAYKQISEDLLFMDKWTQFDWSLTLPHNAFFSKISNPLLVEADIFGEFFGKGHLPLMLKEHITQKIGYCEKFSPAGYVARIDRAGQIPFGSVNEVNLHIMNAFYDGTDPEKAIDAFFKKKYPGAFKEVRALMEPTEEILRSTIYTKGYYFSELSRFPTLNHCKNHFYFEMMRENYQIVSNEWFIPKNWNRESLESVLDEKRAAAAKAAELFEELEGLKDRIDPAEYEKLWKKFKNLQLVTEIWKTLVCIFMDYAAYFEKQEKSYAEAFECDLQKICDLRDEGLKTLENDFYCVKGGGELGLINDQEAFDYIGAFVEEVRESFFIEKEAYRLLSENPALTDYVVCGGAMEGHQLKKEVNFSDTLVRNKKLCRIPGNKNGMSWSSINAHGWFSYTVKVLPGQKNSLHIALDNMEGVIDAKITVGEKETILHEETKGIYEAVIPYTAAENETEVNIRFDKISKDTPCIYSIQVC